MKIGICDDDKYTVAELERLIYDIATEKRLKVEVEAYYDGSSIENDIVKGVKFDLVFLDIEMKQNGITTAKRIRELKNDFLIIYIYSDSHRRSNAYSFNVFAFQIGRFFSQYFIVESFKIFIQFVRLHRSFSYSHSNYSEFIRPVFHSSAFKTFHGLSDI